MTRRWISGVIFFSFFFVRKWMDLPWIARRNIRDLGKKRTEPGLYAVDPESPACVRTLQIFFFFFFYFFGTMITLLNHLPLL